MPIVFLLYVAIGYWDVSQNFLYTPILGYRYLWIQTVICAIFLGWLVIPIVIYKQIKG